MIKSILVGVCDRLHTLSAATYASEIARRCGGEVSVIAVTDFGQLAQTNIPMDMGHAAEFTAERIEDNEEAVRDSRDLLIRRLEGDGVKSTMIHESGESFTALINAAKYHDLMVFGLRGLFDHGVANEPPDELVRLADASVRPILAVGPKHQEIQRVMIGYSGSNESALALKSYACANLWPGALVKIVHFGDSEGEGPLLLSRAREYLRTHNIAAEIALVDQAKPNLLEVAHDWNADLIVLGNSAKSLWRRRIFGETALQTMRNSDLPLFIA